jgi:hypothetical protein
VGRSSTFHKYWYWQKGDDVQRERKVFYLTMLSLAKTIGEWNMKVKHWWNDGGWTIKILGMWHNGIWKYNMRLLLLNTC